MMIKGRMGKALSIICAGALAFAISGYATSANAAPKKVTIKVWDPGLMGHLVDGVMDTKNSFIFKAKTAYEKLNPHVTINISEIDGGVSDTQFRAASPSCTSSSEFLLWIAALALIGLWFWLGGKILRKSLA